MKQRTTTVRLASSRSTSRAPTASCEPSDSLCPRWVRTVTAYLTARPASVSMLDTWNGQEARWNGRLCMMQATLAPNGGFNSHIPSHNASCVSFQTASDGSRLAWHHATHDSPPSGPDDHLPVLGQERSVVQAA